MQRIKFITISLVFVLVLYLTAIVGIFAVTELDSSAATIAPQMAVENLAQPTLSRRDITRQQFAPSHNINP